MIATAIRRGELLAYIEQMLCPTLRVGDIVICDNPGSHKISGAGGNRGTRSITALPAPYSPDLNPIELAPTIAPSLRQEPLAVVYADLGDQMLASKDVSAARKLYEYAANAGSARAAIALARTYDPSFLRQLGAIGVKPDPGLATAWYRKAAALGDRDAASLADNLAHSNPQ